jgi:hypothetical protein
MKVFSVVGGRAGKTEIVRRVVAELTRQGLRDSAVERVPDMVDQQEPGSGTWKHREAGLPAGYADAMRTGLWPSTDVLPPAELTQTGVPLALGSVKWPAMPAVSSHP